MSQGKGYRIGLANGNLGYFFGALYLFCINCLFITLATYFMVKYLRFKKMEYQEEKFGRRTQRLTTILIILFLVPSIWSAVILVKQTNFEDHAIEFVEHHKSIEKCVIYDYRISHTDGSVLEIFLTGEPISDQARTNLYAYALEHGIKAEQLSIREYTTDAGSQNNELLKNLYGRLDTEVSQREKTISTLTQELESLKTQELPYTQLAKEIRATCPAISNIILTRGVHVSTDSRQMTPYILVKIQADSSMTESGHQKLEEWLKVRLETDNLKVDISD